MEIIIDENLSGKTIKTIVREMGISRNQLIELKKDPRGILLNGEHVTVRAAVSQGDTLSLATEDTSDDENPYIPPLDIPLDVIYEDDHLIAVDKPQGMPTHPSLYHHDDTLANALVAYFQKKGTPFVFRAVNRLDSGTAGVVLVAKDHLTSKLMCEQMQEGKINKTYLMLVHGDAGERGEIEGYIRRKGVSIIERELLREPCEGGEYSLTEWEKVASGDDVSLIKAHPKTGRTHQLRVHFASIGHSLIGDSLYGEADTRIAHQALFASELCFMHPYTKEKMLLCAKMPKEMQKICEDCFGKTDFE